MFAVKIRDKATVSGVNNSHTINGNVNVITLNRDVVRKKWRTMTPTIFQYRANKRRAATTKSRHNTKYQTDVSRKNS